MEALSERVQNLSESATIAMARRSRELQKAGEDVISLSLGEPDFQTPEFICEAGKQAIVEGYTKYPPVNGYEDLRESICDKFQRENGLTFTPDRIVVSTGAKQSIANAVMTLVGPGDEVILPAPYWVTYYEIVKMAEGVPKVVPTSVKNNHKITPARLKEEINERTKLLLFSSPCNPSGSSYTREELETFAPVIADHPNLYVISDEIYEYINFGEEHFSLGALPELKDRVITVNGVSKGFAMTGWRIGYMGAPEAVAKACTKFQGQFTSGPCGVAQRAAKTAIEAGFSAVKPMVEGFAKRRELVWEKLRHMEGMVVNKPGGAFYFFPDVSAFLGTTWNGRKLENATDLSMFLLEEARVSTVTGEAFGSPEGLRLSYAASEETLNEALTRIETALSKLTI